MKIGAPAILVSAVLILVVVQAFQLATINKNITGLATGSVGLAEAGPLGLSGWTEDEKMNYEMHGIIPARASKSSSSTAGIGMVGGC